MEIALVIPCFNEAKRLSATFALLEDFFVTPHRHMVTIVFVDDGSTDDSRTLLDVFLQKPHKNFKSQLVVHDHNRGKGAAIISGWESIEADVYGFFDADLSFSLKALWPTVEALQNHDAVIAKRSDQSTEYSRVRNLASGCMRFLARRLTGVRATSPQSGWKFLTRQAAKKVLPQLTQTRFAFDLELLLLLQADKARIYELPLSFTHHAKSSVKTRDGIRYLTDLLAISDSLPFNHARFVWMLAAGSLILSFVLYGWVIRYGYFFSDDFTGLWYGKQIVADIHGLISLHAATFFSPVINAYWALGFKFFGVSAPLFFIGNILIHAGVAWLAGLLAWEMTESRLNAWCAAVLVTISGSAYEPVVWIAANMHSLATLWIVGALYGGVRFYKTQKWSAFCAGLICQLLAYGTKEISIVLFPLLCIALWSVWHQKKQRLTHSVGVFILSSALLWSAYAALQFIMQQGGDTFAGNGYAIGWQGLMRVPFALLDLFIPLQAFTGLLTPVIAAVIGFAVLVCGGYIVREYRSLPSLPLACGLCLLGIMPTIFFLVPSWWEPLASRYTYLGHVGAAFLLATIFVSIIKQHSYRAIHILTVVLLALSLSQFIFMIHAVVTRYAYVYKTGSTLAHAARLLNPVTKPILYIYPDHPFPSNKAHILGALNVYTNYKPEQVVFLSPGERVDLSPERMLLYWQPKHGQYELTS
ncbi:glycosyltransferase, partial [Patescibacteria group bacterium]|nr:glycosyltransferase [Patescibacteria group bacterium]